jgi:hypothetical protein
MGFNQSVVQAYGYGVVLAAERTHIRTIHQVRRQDMQLKKESIGAVQHVYGRKPIVVFLALGPSSYHTSKLAQGNGNVQ